MYDFETRTEGPIIKIFGTITDYLFRWLRSAPSVGDVSRGLRDAVHVCVHVFMCVFTYRATCGHSFLKVNRDKIHTITAFYENRFFVLPFFLLVVACFILILFLKKKFLHHLIYF